jgi:hypothetical protein
VQAPAVRYEVYGFRCAANIDYFGAVFGVYEFSDFFAAALMEFRGFLAESVDCAVDVAIVVFVEVAFCVEDLAGFLGGGGVVEIN